MCNVKGVRSTVWWIRLSDDSDYSEHPHRDERPIDLLLPLLPPPVPRALPWLDQLAQMEIEGNFRFYPGQPVFISHLAQASGVLIAAEVGCGKTLMAIALVRLLRPRRCLIIAPQGVIIGKGEDVSQWEAEFTRFLPGQPVERVNTVKDALASATGVHLTYMQEALMTGGGWLDQIDPAFYDMIIVDEAHLLQNHRTIMAQSLFRLNPRWRYALTATPVGNKVEDCYRLVRWLQPSFYIYEPYSSKPVLVPASPLLTYKSLAHAVAPIRKRDIRSDLPPLVVHKIMVKMDEPERLAYEKLAATFTLPRGGAGQIERVRLTMLRNLVAGFDSKVRAINARRNGPRVVACARVQQTGLIVKGVGEHTYGRIDSTRNPSLNARTASQFRDGEISDLYLGIKCAYGYSFPDCSAIHLGSIEWSWGALDQACGRVYRINSMKPVDAWVYLSEDTIEEQMFDQVCAKQSAAYMALYGESNETTHQRGLDTYDYPHNKTIATLTI